jgi:hypothetical protein
MPNLMKWCVGLSCITIVSCSDCDNPSMDETAENDASLPSCEWTSSSEAADASDESCRTGRTLLKCELANGTTHECISDNSTTCSESNSTESCHNQCDADEYGAWCGGPPTPGEEQKSTAPPSAACRRMQIIPAGVITYCCPCAS